MPNRRRELNRRQVLTTGATLVGVAAAAPLLTSTSAAAARAVTLSDDFTVLGTQEILGRTIVDSAGTSYTWSELYPSPAWHSGPYFSTGDPGIVDGRLQRRHPSTAMYPGVSLPRVPRRVEVDFVYDESGRGGRSVFIHLFADTNGERSIAEVPFHLSVGEGGFAVKAISTVAGDTALSGFGRAPDTGSIAYESGEKLPFGVPLTVRLDFSGNSVQITLPAATLTPPVSLTDTRLTSARHPGGGDGRFLVLEDESDSGREPYNAFTAVRIVI